MSHPYDIVGLVGGAKKAFASPANNSGNDLTSNQKCANVGFTKLSKSLN